MPRRVTSGNMVYLAPERSASQTETSATASNRETTAGLAESQAEAPAGINAQAVAEKVYRLMQRDLILESERVTRLGG